VCVRICRAVKLNSVWKWITHQQVGLAVMFQAHIQEMISSTLPRDSVYPDRGFLWFSSVPPARCQASTSISQYCIPEGISSTLSKDTVYPDSGFLWISSVPPGKYQDSTSVSQHCIVIIIPTQNFLWRME
jgi:hypothetical protein